MADWDVEQVADAYLVNPDDWLLDDARYDPLAADTADEHVECPTCGDTHVIHVADFSSSAYFPKRGRTYRCPDCTQETR